MHRVSILVPGTQHLPSPVLAAGFPPTNIKDALGARVMIDPSELPPEIQHLIEKRERAERRTKERRRWEERRLVDLGSLDAIASGEDSEDLDFHERRSVPDRREQRERRKTPRRRSKQRRDEE